MEIESLKTKYLIDQIFDLFPELDELVEEKQISTYKYIIANDVYCFDFGKIKGNSEHLFLVGGSFEKLNLNHIKELNLKLVKNTDKVLNNIFDFDTRSMIKSLNTEITCQKIHEAIGW